MSLPTASSRKLAARVQEAIEDHKLSQKEYQELLAIVHEDGRVDAHERALMDQLLSMIEDGSVKLVP